MRIRSAGIVGIDDGWLAGTDWPSDNTIDGDNDGLILPVPNFVLDLSKIASNALGRQAPMMASYKVHSMRIGIRPSDDTIDNDHAAHFGGEFVYVLATEHAKTAMQLARKTDKATEATQVDGDSLFLSDDKDYSGFRYNWGDTAIVDHPTANGVSGMNSVWTVQDILVAYNEMTRPCESNALFNGRFPGPIGAMWECGWSNKPYGAMGTGRGDCQRDMHVEILPLIGGFIKHSHVNEPGTVDDEYHVHIEVDFTIGGTF